MGTCAAAPLLPSGLPLLLPPSCLPPPTTLWGWPLPWHGLSRHFQCRRRRLVFCSEHRVCVRSRRLVCGENCTGFRCIRLAAFCRSTSTTHYSQRAGRHNFAFAKQTSSCFGGSRCVSTCRGKEAAVLPWKTLFPNLWVHRCAVWLQANVTVSLIAKFVESSWTPLNILTAHQQSALHCWEAARMAQAAPGRIQQCTPVPHVGDWLVDVPQSASRGSRLSSRLWVLRKFETRCALKWAALLAVPRCHATSGWVCSPFLDSRTSNAEGLSRERVLEASINTDAVGRAIRDVGPVAVLDIESSCLGFRRSWTPCRFFRGPRYRSVERLRLFLSCTTRWLGGVIDTACRNSTSDFWEWRGLTNII